MLNTSDAHQLAAERRFRVGRDREGRWVAVETSGASGGIFTSREAALHYAQAETYRQPGAVSISPEPLDLKI